MDSGRGGRSVEGPSVDALLASDSAGDRPEASVALPPGDVTRAWLDAPRAAATGALEAERSREAESLETDAVDADDPRYVFTGRLLSVDGEVLEGSVEGIDGDGLKLVADPDFDGSGGSGGSGFRVVGHRPGRWWITARAAGHRVLQTDVFVELEGRAVERDLVLHPASMIDVRILDPDGESVLKVIRERSLPLDKLGLAAVATLEEPGARWSGEGVGRTELVADGEAGTLRGRLALEVEPPLSVGLVANEAVLAVAAVVPGQTGVDFFLSPDALAESFAGLRIRFVDEETSEPVTAGAVGLGVARWAVCEQLDDEGVASFESCTPGEASLTTLIPGYAPFELDVLLEPGSVFDAGEVALQRSASIVGTVVDPEGRPVGASLVGWAKIEDTGGVSAGVAFHQTMDDSTFRLDLTPGRHVLWARSFPSPSSVSRNVVVDVSAGTVEELRIVASAPTRVLLVPATDVWSGSPFTIFDENGHLLADGVLEGSKTKVVHVAGGYCVLRVTDGTGEIRAELPFRAEGDEFRLPLD